MSTVTLGDLLRNADRRFERTTTGSGSLTAAAAVPYLRRILQALTRYTRRDDPALRAALTAAAMRLEEAESHLPPNQSRTPSPRARALAAAADLLTAGADLLHTHTSTDSTGTYQDRSRWAQVLRTHMLDAAMAGEVTHWADRVADLCAQLAARRGPVGSPVPDYLAAVARILTDATKAPPATAETGKGRVTGWELLYAVPTATPPARRSPETTETPADLCDGISITAHRLASIAFASAPAGLPLTFSAQTWHRTAHTTAVLLETSRLAIDAAARRDQRADLAVAAVALGQAHQGWTQIEETWDVIATDTNTPVSALTVETQDLTLRLCRLAFGDPRWAPRRGARLPPDLVAIPDNPEQILTAIHYAVDAVAQMADADLDAIRRFASNQRFYLPSRILDNPYARSGKLTPAPADRVHLLIDSYLVAARETTRAAGVLDELAIRHTLNSRVLGMARKALQLEQSASGDDIDPDDLALRLRYLDRPYRAYGAPADELNQQAVIRAYRDQRLTLQQCGDRFTTSAATIAKILRDNEVERRSPGPPRQIKDPFGNPQPASDPPQDPVDHGPVEQQMRDTGINDPSVIAKATELDQAVARYRLAETTAAIVRSRRTAAQLARTDIPPSPRSSGTSTLKPKRTPPSQSATSKRSAR